MIIPIAVVLLILLIFPSLARVTITYRNGSIQVYDVYTPIKAVIKLVK